MLNETLTKISVLALTAGFLAACNAKPAVRLATNQPNTVPPSSTQPITTPATTADQATGSDLCTNELAPVKLGATWTYGNTGGAVSPSSFTTTITDVRQDSFTVSTKFDDSMTADQKWVCKPDGLLAESLGAGQTALGLSLQGIQADLSTSNATGLTLPSHVTPGMKWPYSLDLAGTLSQGSLSAKLTGTVSTSMEAIGMESVTVPAGTFDAMKVQSVSTFKVMADYHGLAIPVTSVVNTTFWFAPGVGWIKSAESGELAGTAVNTVTELQSYTIP